MSVKILIDMNLSPDWVPVLKRHGWSAVHWSTPNFAHIEYEVFPNFYDKKRVLRQLIAAFLISGAKVFPTIKK